MASLSFWSPQKTENGSIASKEDLEEKATTQVQRLISFSSYNIDRTDMVRVIQN